MTISTRIAALEADHRLMRYTPRGPKPPKRPLYLAAPAWKDLTDSSTAVNSLAGKGYVLAALDRWTLGELIYGDRKKCRFLCLLSPPPDEIWEIRVTEPVVQARLFGRFAEPDTLILTKFHTRTFLGKKGSANWQACMNECERVWTELFEGAPPFSGGDIHDYVTEECDDFPI